MELSMGNIMLVLIVLILLFVAYTNRHDLL